MGMYIWSMKLAQCVRMFGMIVEAAYHHKATRANSDFVNGVLPRRNALRPQSLVVLLFALYCSSPRRICVSLGLQTTIRARALFRYWAAARPRDRPFELPLQAPPKNLSPQYIIFPPMYPMQTLCSTKCHIIYAVSLACCR